ncbi:MAG TPA: multiheme c-type cytochrome [Bryobacteraceae bacterium]|nr:multiheme c-type cytochrome [Bryobacteraceae bacterium]
MARSENSERPGWGSALARLTVGWLILEAVTGLAVTFGPFHASVEWSLIVHTVVGAAMLLPACWYTYKHWLAYRDQAVSDVVVLGYAAAAALLVCCASGVVVTFQALLATRTSPVWRNIHLISTFALLVTVGAHGVLAFLRTRKLLAPGAGFSFLRYAVQFSLAGLAVTALIAFIFPGDHYANQFPKGYSFLYGKNRPFAPSLARTSTGGAFDARSLSGSATCGTAGCHSEILAEWKPSAHRYAAMDSIFQGIQTVMAKQNGPESTRYCGGCHDPISLFSGTKNIFVENLTGLDGYNEGVSCLACHSIQKTDIQGNANFTVVQPRQYLWQWSSQGAGRVARDFLIRAYPQEHLRLSKRMYKAPEYCAACHKQFIDQEVNRVGWVQLQNQYDNWKASHWNHKGDPTRTVECRECHMPLIESHDPAAGDSADYNRNPNDGKHRSHRFLAANNMMPKMLHLEGADRQAQLTEQWLQGKIPIPEIRQKWAEGPVVKMHVETPAEAAPGSRIPIRVVLTSNKVGHDFPTGPLDLIQSWVEINVTDDAGNVILASGRRDEKHFIEPGTFLFKAEPVDQYGNLIDRHNLWEMVGVRYRRSLFPGYSDTVEYQAACPASVTRAARAMVDGQFTETHDFGFNPRPPAHSYRVSATLHYRKVDQFLLNYVLGEKAGLTAPVVDIASATTTVAVRTKRVSQRGSDSAATLARLSRR